MKLSVGDLVTVDRRSGVNAAGARAVVVEAYTLMEREHRDAKRAPRPGWMLLFEDGRADGFSPGDCTLFEVRRVGHCAAVAGYVFRSMTRLAADYRAGFFGPAWAAVASAQQPPRGTNCGNCLMERVEIVVLNDGVCPKCGADYRQAAHGGGAR